MEQEEIEQENEFDSLLNRFVNSYQSVVVWFNPTYEALSEFCHKNWFLSVSAKDLKDIIRIKQQEDDIKRRSYLKDRIEQIQDAMMEEEINNLIDKAKPNITSNEKLDLKRSLEKALKECEDKYDFNEIKTIVESVLDGDYQEKDQKISSWGRIINFGGYVWTIVIGVVSVFIILAILNSTYDDGLVITYAILILIYLSLQSFINGIGYFLVKQSNIAHDEFNRIRLLLNDEPTAMQKREYEESQTIINKAVNKSFISGVFIFIGYIITIFFLIGSL